MIGEINFKGLCDHAERGTPIRALYITPITAERDAQMLDMQNMALARGLPVLAFRQGHLLEIGPAVAYLRVAHPYLDRELKAHEWHWIHGLEYLDVFDDAAAIRANLEMRVRL